MLIQVLVFLFSLFIGAALELGNYSYPRVAIWCFVIAGVCGCWIVVAFLRSGALSRLRENRKLTLLSLVINPLSQALSFHCKILDVQYEPDMNWLGICWVEGCVDVRLYIHNTANVRIENVDLTVRLDTSLAGVGQTTPLEMISEILQTMTVDSVGVGSAGHPPRSVPVRGNLLHAFFITSDNSARLQLPSIPGRYRVEVVLATIAMSSLNDKQQRPPKRIEITGHYETTPIDGWQRYQFTFSQDF